MGLEEQPAASPAPPRHLSERAIIIITSLGHAICHMGELAYFGLMAAVITQFDLKEDQATALALPGLILMGAGALPVGAWADSWGHGRVFLIYFLAMATSCLAVALAPNVWVLCLTLTLLGLAASIYHPVGVAMLSLGVKARNRAMGVNGVAGSVGVALGPALGLGAAYLGWWPLAYLIIGGLSLLAAGLMIVTFRGRGLVTVEVAGKSARAHSTPVPQGNGRLSRPYLVLALFFLVMMLGGFNYRCLMTALPLYLKGGVGSGSEREAAAVLIVMGVLLIGGVGQYFGGRIGEQLGARRVYFTLIGLLIPLTVGLATLQGTFLMLPMACLVAVCLFGQQPVENGLLADATSAGRRGISYGLKFTLTFGIGALGTQAAGWMWRATHSPGPAFYMIAGSALLMAGLVATIGWLHRGDPAGSKTRLPA